jgi:glycosyltransferase involved in cell wall biosynthesis
VVEPPPSLTIGLPVYNGADYLEAAVDSLLGQSYIDFELIISDNASTDATEAIGRAAAAKDPRVTFRRNPQNLGLDGNFNLLVPLARGRYFKWATADDQLLPGYLERCVEVLEADPSVVLAYPRTTFVDGLGNLLDRHDPGWHLVSDDVSERLRYAIGATHFVNAALGVIRTDALRRTRLHAAYPGGDFRLMAELSILGKFVEVPETLYVRRIHTGSTGGNTGNVSWQRRYRSGSRPAVRGAFMRLMKDRAAIVLGAPIPIFRRVALLAYLGHETAYQWRRVVSEVVESLRRES